MAFTGGPQNADSTWSTPANWDPHQVPVDGDSVIIGDNSSWATPIFDGGALTLQNLSVARQSLIPGYGSVITVTESFSWTGGSIVDGGTISVTGLGSITGGPGGQPGSTWLGNDCVLDVSGTLTINGPGSLTIGGGQCRVLNSGTIVMNKAGIFWVAGAPPLITNNGTITIIGSVQLIGGDITNHGTVDIPAGGELVLTGDAVLRLAAKGKITGSGVLHPADSGGPPGRLSVETDTVLPSGMTVNLTGAGLIGSDADPPTISKKLQIDGILSLNGGTLYYAHIVIDTKAHCAVSGNTSSVLSGEVDNLGVITLLPGSVWDLNSGAQLKNSGRLSLQGGASLFLSAGFANLSNSGLIESTGATPNHIDTLPVSSTGSVAVRQGTLDLTNQASLTVTGGSVFLYETTLDSSDASGSLALAGGSAGGVLRGSGTIGAAVTNGGSIEPGAAGLTLRGGYIQDDNGSLVLPLSTWNSGSRPPITVTGPASLAGSLFITE